MSSGGQNDSMQNMGGYQQQPPGSNSNESNNPNSNLTDEDELLSLIDYDWKKNFVDKQKIGCCDSAVTLSAAAKV